MDPAIIAKILSGLARACRQNGCALIGGETAELPGVYPRGEYDLVGTIIGAVRKSDVITGKSIRPGHVLIGLHSSGCHTNGYTLARQALFNKARLKLNDVLPGTRTRVVEALLAPHRSYLKPVRALMEKVRIRGMAHITGGGFPDNIRRILPPEVDAVVDTRTWDPPALFQVIQKSAAVDPEEMHRVFNMGIGMVIVVARGDAPEAIRILKKAGERPCGIGYIHEGQGDVKMLYR